MNSDSRELDLPEFLGGRVDPTPTPRIVARDGRMGTVPGETGLWVFIFGDMTLFGAFFIVLMWQRRATPDVFAISAQELVRGVGVVNTAILLFSSYLVVSALWAQRSGVRGRARLSLWAALACAATFAGLKIFEYLHMLRDGHSPTADPFFTFYFVLTGVHLLHVLIGAGLLMFWARGLSRGRPTPAPRFVEGIAVYWHMVDLLWVVIFTLLYLVCAA